MNTNEIRKFFEIIKDNNKLTEIRILGDNGFKKAFSGYFTDIEELLKQIVNYDEYHIYFTLNEINEACAGRSQMGKIMQSPKAQTSDGDITAREWVLIDLDPKRPADTNSSKEEKKKAYTVCGKVFNYLKMVGFAAPIVADSGNGYHLLYKVSMKNEPEKTEIIKKFLQVLSMLFSDNDVDVDTSVFNASRICKVYGTSSRKGANTEDRPQRESRIVWVPDEIKFTSFALFEKVAKELPEQPKLSYSNNFNTQFDIDDFLRRNGIVVEKEMMSGGIRKILLKECPFDSNHKSPDSAIFVMSNGAIGFKCLHNSCSNNNWHTLREKYEPKTRRDNFRFTTPQAPPQKVLADDRGAKFLNLCDITAIDRNSIVTIPSRFTELDKAIIGFNIGEVSLWSGTNSAGKSTVLSLIAINAADAGFATAMISAELKPERVKQWLHLQIAGRQYNKKNVLWDSYSTPDDVGLLIDHWIKDKLWVYNNKYGNKIIPLLDDLKEIVAKGAKCVILDNLMSIDILEMEGWDKNDKQKAFILKLCDFAKENNIHIHVVAHPRKSSMFLRKTDIAGTADLTNAVDNVFIVHRVNNDFTRLSSEFFTEERARQYFGFDNVIEICKNRDLGMEDKLVGLYFEKESKRFLNFKYENINYGWIPVQSEVPFADYPADIKPNIDDFDDLPT